MAVRQHAGAFSISLIFSLVCKSMGARQFLALYQLLPDFCLHAEEIWAQRPSWQAYTISWIQMQAINVSLQVYQACIFFGLFLFLSGRSSFEVRLHFSWFSNTLFSADEYHVVTELTSHERSVFNDQLPKLLQSLKESNSAALSGSLRWLCSAHLCYKHDISIGNESSFVSCSTLSLHPVLDAIPYLQKARKNRNHKPGN